MPYTKSASNLAVHFSQLANPHDNKPGKMGEFLRA